MGILTDIISSLGKLGQGTTQSYQNQAGYDPAAFYAAQQQAALGMPQYNTAQYGMPYGTQPQYAQQSPYGVGIQNYGMDNFYSGNNGMGGYGYQQGYDPYGMSYFNPQQLSWPYGLPASNNRDPYLSALSRSVLPVSSEEIGKVTAKFANELRENSGDVDWTWNFDHDIKAKDKEIMREFSYYNYDSVVASWSQIGDHGALGPARTNNSVYDRWFGSQFAGTPNQSTYPQYPPYQYPNPVPYGTGGIKWPTYL